MTQVFEADGTVVPATVIKAGPCVVVQAKTAQTDGYEAVQLGLVDETPAQGQQADGGPLQEGRRAADARAPRSEGRAGRRRRSRPAIRCSSNIFSGGRPRGRDRDEPRQGLPGRHEAPSLRRRRRDARVDVPSRARIDWRVVVSVTRRQGHARGRPHGRRSRDDAQPARSSSVDAEQPPAGAARRGARRARTASSSCASAVAQQAGSEAAGRRSEEGQEVGT